jgi:hypothetical protein
VGSAGEEGNDENRQSDEADTGDDATDSSGIELGGGPTKAADRNVRTGRLSGATWRIWEGHHSAWLAWATNQLGWVVAW